MVYTVLLERRLSFRLNAYINIALLRILNMANVIEEASIHMSLGRDESHVHDECEKAFLDTF